MPTSEENTAALSSAVSTLNRITGDQSTPKTIKKEITEIVSALKADGSPLPVRAAGAISALDDITQDPNMPSYVRTSLWQVVSTLEGIRE